MESCKGIRPLSTRLRGRERSLHCGRRRSGSSNRWESPQTAYLQRCRNLDPPRRGRRSSSTPCRSTCPGSVGRPGPLFPCLAGPQGQRYRFNVMLLDRGQQAEVLGGVTKRLGQLLVAKLLATSAKNRYLRLAMLPPPKAASRLVWVEGLETSIDGTNHGSTSIPLTHSDYELAGSSDCRLRPSAQ